LKHLKVLGCKAVIHVPKQKRLKPDPKGKEVIGYCAETKAYRFIDPKTKNVTISRDAVFLEDQFYSLGNEKENSSFYILPDSESLVTSN
jgi:hypothetical protein